MTPEQIDRVFGRGRLKMVTGEHVEVYREAVAPGERRRYTKRFLNTTDGDFAQWTEREWRILARLIGHGIRCVPDVVQFDRGSAAGTPLVQTYDAGVTVDQWATLLPLVRDGRVYRHVFEDCAHWWALAHHCLAALNEIHQLHLVHLDIKGDNVCIPFGPAAFDPDSPELRLYPIFGELALIDFAFALVSRERVTTPLPIGWQKDYDYQSPRLLKALEDGRNDDLRRTRELDWRCDIYSLAAMLKRYLPDEGTVHQPERSAGWTGERYEAAKAMLLTLRDWHDRDAPQQRPHEELMAATGARLTEGDLARSLASGWTLARDANVTPAGASPLTPMTRLAAPIRVFVSPRVAAVTRSGRAPLARREAGAVAAVTRSGRAPLARREAGTPLLVTRRGDVPGTQRRAGVRHAALASAAMLAIGAAAMPLVFPDAARSVFESGRSFLDTAQARSGSDRAAAENARSDTAPDPGSGAQQPAEAPPLPTVVPAEEPATAVPEATPAAPLANEESISPVVEAAQEANAEPGLAGTGVLEAPTPEAASRRPQTKPKAAAQANDAAQRDKRAPANATPPTLARSPKPSARPNAKSPPVVASGSAAGRGVLATTTGSRAGVPVAPAAEAIPRIETPSAPAQVALAAPPGPGTQPPMTGAVPEEANGTTVHESQPSAAPAASATRPRRPAPASEKRGEVGLFTWLFQRAQRTLAPIEERRTQPSGRREPAPGAQPTPSLPQDTLAQAPAVSDGPRIQPQSPPALPPAVSRAPPPRALPESPVGSLASDRARETEFALQARRTLAQTIPRTAVRTQAEVARVLWTAANAYDPAQERAVSDAAQAVWTREDVSARPTAAEASDARRLNDEAMRAYWYRRNVAEAFDLQMKAFGANPYDPEVAGNLAFLHLRVTPEQPEVARQLALHAIAVRGAQYPAGRLEDWHTYAVASALTGRDADARNALFVTVALAKNVERNCKAGQIAIASYGERVREPVNAMLYRIHTQGRAYASPHCMWPTNWSASARLQ